MKTRTHSLEIHPDFDRDPESRALERLLAAERVWRRRVARAESGIHVRRKSL